MSDSERMKRVGVCFEKRRGLHPKAAVFAFVAG